MTMDTATRQAFIATLEQDPEFRHQVRQLLLSAELLELPERFAAFAAATTQRLERLEADVAELKTDVAELKTDVAELKTDVAELKTNMTKLETKTDQINGRLDNGFGTNYELKVAANIGSIAGRSLGLRRTQVLKSASVNAPHDADLIAMIEAAEDAGQITDQELYDLLMVDIIFTGRSRAGGDTSYVAAEISIAASDDDVTRAYSRAQTLAAVVPHPVNPAVITSRIEPAQSELAASKGVTVMTLPFD